MAIAPITVGDVESISKINQAIAKANLVDGKAAQGDLASEISARQAAVSAEASARSAETAARIAADNAEEAARFAADSSLQGAIAREVSDRGNAIKAANDARDAADARRPLYGEAMPASSRPGEAPRFFTSDLLATPASAAPISDAWRAVGSSGAVIAVPGAGKVAPVAVSRIEPGHQYRVRTVFQRAVNTDDPANDAVRIGLQWLTRTKADGGMTVCADVLDLTVNKGRQEFSFNVARSDAENIDFVAPASAIYVRPFVQVFGAGVTHVEVVEIIDLSIAADWSPDVSALQREIAGLRAHIETLTDRIDAIES